MCEPATWAASHNMHACTPDGRAQQEPNMQQTEHHDTCMQHTAAAATLAQTYKQHTATHPSTPPHLTCGCCRCCSLLAKRAALCKAALTRFPS